METMSLELQKKNILDLKAQIDLIIGRVQVTKDTVNSQLDFAVSNGLPIEIYNKYKGYYLANLYIGLDNLCNRLQRENKGYLTEVEIKITEALNK